MPYIYKIENLINGKVYIGKTLYEIDRRWRQHIQNSKIENYSHMPLYNAMRKYGIDNFEITQVEYIENADELSDREKYWIEQYNSYFNGYNATRGGDGSLLYDYDIIWDYWTQGYSIKDISKKIGCNDFVVRTVLDIHKISTHERKQRSEEAQLRSHKPYMRRVNQINPDTLEIVHTYNSISEAALSIPCDSSYLAKCCKGELSAFGYL